mmetsp:Transcript_41840/g.110817  ORF Transcript_41840/g.110817 Transcript_41840/m.110817 type:complete len:238 (+) Transcript_41840:2943-3656(+)
MYCMVHDQNDASGKQRQEDRQRPVQRKAEFDVAEGTFLWAPHGHDLCVEEVLNGIKLRQAHVLQHLVDNTQPASLRHNLGSKIVSLPLPHPSKQHAQKGDTRHGQQEDGPNERTTSGRSHQHHERQGHALADLADLVDEAAAVPDGKVHQSSLRKVAANFWVQASALVQHSSAETVDDEDNDSLKGKRGIGGEDGLERQQEHNCNGQKNADNTLAAAIRQFLRKYTDHHRCTQAASH